MHALLVCVVLAAIGVDVEIVGPTAVSCPGDYLLLHVQQPADSPELIFTWDVEPRHQGLVQIVPSPDGTSAQLMTRPGKWRVTVSAVDAKAKRGVIVSHDVTVPGTQYVPNPNPQPKPEPPVPVPPGPNPQPVIPPVPGPNPPPPVPPAPDAPFAALTTNVKTWLGTVDSPDRATEAGKIAQGCTEIAKRCDDGDLAKLSGQSLRIGVVSAVVQINSAAIGTHSANWQAFVKQVNDAASGYVASGQLSTAADWSKFLTAFAAGLR